MPIWFRAVLILVCFHIVCAPVAAQQSVTSQPPPVIVPDRNGVDLRTGTIARYAFETNIGSRADPAISIINGRTGPGAKTGTAIGGHVSAIRCTQSNYNYCNNWKNVVYRSYSAWFHSYLQGDGFVSDKGEAYQADANGIITVNLSDETVVRFDTSRTNPYYCNPQYSTCVEDKIIASFFDATKSDGEVIISANPYTAGNFLSKSSLGYIYVYKNDGTNQFQLLNTSTVKCDLS